VSFIAIVAAAQWLRGPLYYPQLVVEARQDLRLEFLQEGLRKEEDCEAASAAIADAVRLSCPACRVVAQQCLAGPDPARERLLSDAPIGVPSSRLPHGVVSYVSHDQQLALDACRETERLSGGTQGYRAACFAPESARPLPGSTREIGLAQLAIGLLALLASGMAAAFAGALILRYRALHARWSMDPVEAAPQKSHATPTPRIGGLCVIAGLLVSEISLYATGQSGTREIFGGLLLAGAPAFLVGFAEDATKRVSVAARLLLTMLAAAAGAWLVGAVIPRLDVPGLDTLLKWSPFAIAFTAFAVCGVTHSINIIDGYNGLAGGVALVALAAMAWVSALLGDGFLLVCALAMIGALLGFLVWNYPKGKIFLGDGGAYLVGFWLGELSVLIVVRHPEVSPWFPLLALVYPIFETVFSIYRKKVLKGLSPGQPDGLHLHHLIYRRLARDAPAAADPAAATRRNNRVAPFGVLIALLCAVPAVLLWRETVWLVAASLLFCAAYLWLTLRLTLGEGAAAGRA
jgi:UDP-N-acetylmuramyl pentapeptide phosphotransferase/UDP-N-acetylglucosamine-1-phosphate transferase